MRDSIRRARELRPIVAAADHVLDLCTAADVEAFWVYQGLGRNADAALAIGRPQMHMVMPRGLGSGTPLIQHGRLAQTDHHGALVGFAAHGRVQAETIDIGAQALARRGLQRPQRVSLLAAAVGIGQPGLAQVLHQHALTREPLQQPASRCSNGWPRFWAAATEPD